MSEDLDPRQYMPVWSNPAIDNPVLPIENPQSPTTHDYAVFRAAAPTDDC
ncbi:hypothetical protein [Nocardia concava]|nr:hypothetical protein [Nocardia concava]